jgi:hypothetical protein
MGAFPLAMTMMLAGCLSVQASSACTMTTEPDPRDLLPRRYMEFPADAELFQRYLQAVHLQQARDIAFARFNGTIKIEGPWDDIASQEVAYVGIDECGQRVRLPAISQFWRYSPYLGGYRPEGSDEELTIAIRPPDGVVAVRVELGPSSPGLVMGRPFGQAPVQSYGLIDGKEYYFRSRGDYWSFRIGSADLIQNPEWYYEEPYGVWPDAGGITVAQAQGFILKATALYRTGVPTMRYPN